MARRYMTAHNHSHIALILISVLLGAVITGLILSYPRAQQAITPPVEAQGIAALEDGFVSIADKAMPAVVTITAETVVERRMPQMPDLREFFEGPWFRFPPWFGEPEEEDKEPERRKWEERTPVLGSGWVYTEDGYIVTNSHVVSGARHIRVTLHDVENDPKEYPAKVVGDDPKTELAVIKIDPPRKLPTLALGDSENLRVGQWVLAVGAPFRYEQTVTAGIVSAKGRELRGESKYIQLGDIIQTDASINPGSSGGPLVDLRGTVVGISVAIAAPGLVRGNVGIGFAIPAETAKVVLPQLISGKKVVRGWLGISIANLTENMCDFYGVPAGGVLVENIQADGPAANSDLQEEDVIVAVDGQPVRDTYDLQKVIGRRAPGTTVALDVYRDRKLTQIEVTLGEMPGKYAGLEEEEEEEKEEGIVEEPEEPDTATALGITVRKLSESQAKRLELDSNQGVYVEQVKRDSPAAGVLDKGIVILRVNRDEVDSLEEFESAMEKADKGEQGYVMLRIKVNLYDEWTTRTVDIALDR